MFRNLYSELGIASFVSFEKIEEHYNYLITRVNNEITKLEQTTSENEVALSQAKQEIEETKEDENRRNKNRQIASIEYKLEQSQRDLQRQRIYKAELESTYAILSDPVSKKRYDEELARNINNLKEEKQNCLKKGSQGFFLKQAVHASPGCPQILYVRFNENETQYLLENMRGQCCRSSSPAQELAELASAAIHMALRMGDGVNVMHGSAAGITNEWAIYARDAFGKTARGFSIATVTYSLENVCYNIYSSDYRGLIVTEADIIDFRGYGSCQYYYKFVSKEPPVLDSSLPEEAMKPQVKLPENRVAIDDRVLPAGIEYENFTDLRLFRRSQASQSKPAYNLSGRLWGFGVSSQESNRANSIDLGGRADELIRKKM